jgi:hypothetical protein
MPYRLWSAAAALLLVLALSGCSSETGLPSLAGSDAGAAKRDWGLSRDWHLFAKDSPGPRPVGPEDLIGADGHCGAPVASSPVLNFQAGPEARAGAPALGPLAAPAPAAPAGRGIGLGMTECEVVATAGSTDRVEISAGEQGQRRVVLTYLQGRHPGIYRFEEGRLKSIEKTANMGLPPAKPGKKSRPSGAPN